MILSHFRAATGAVLVETREESRQLTLMTAELPQKTQICTIAAPSGQLKRAKTGKPVDGVTGLASAYMWAAGGPNRVLVVYDLHALLNSPGHWRMLAEALPGMRCPKGYTDGECASLVVAVAPSWELSPHNPLKGLIPVLHLDPPTRAELIAIASDAGEKWGVPVPDQDAVGDALCGLPQESAIQICAEVIQRADGWRCDWIREGRAAEFRAAGLELWSPIHAAAYGGYSGFTRFIDDELVPWIRDPQLSVRRLLGAGVPGVGKSYGARLIAGRLGCECARLSIPSLKGGIVGQSEANLKRALRTLDTMGSESPVVCVIDEIDSIARDGLDGGTSSGMFSELLTWLQESKSQVIILATLNCLDKLDAALESRFSSRFWFDLPGQRERESICEIHLAALGCDNVPSAARALAGYTDGCSGRELAENLIPTVARLTGRKPVATSIAKVCCNFSPASRTQAEQLSQMRRAGASLRRANDPDDGAPSQSRHVASN